MAVAEEDGGHRTSKRRHNRDRAGEAAAMPHPQPAPTGREATAKLDKTKLSYEPWGRRSGPFGSKRTMSTVSGRQGGRPLVPQVTVCQRATTKTSNGSSNERAVTSRIPAD